MIQGVKVLIIQGDNYVLQERDNRSDIAEPGTYSVWGGGVEPEDTSIVAAALRELKEETEIVVGPDALQPIGQFEFEGKKPETIGTIVLTHFFSLQLADDVAIVVREGKGLIRLPKPYQKHERVNRVAEKAIELYESRKG